VARVRVRKWRGVWCTDYTDPRPSPKDGKRHRHIEAHPNKRAAEAKAKELDASLDMGMYMSRRESPTVAEAAASWLAHVKAEGRERTTIDSYEQHVRLHINPALGHYKLSELTRPGIERFKDTLLRDKGMSRPMAKKVLTSLKALIGEAMRVGDAAHNPAHGIKIEMKKPKPLEVGVDIPTTAEIVAILYNKKTNSLARALVAVAACAGLRSGELRGLRWSDIDFKAGKIKVRQAMTRHEKKKSPKSHAGIRTVPIPPGTLNVLDTWRRDQRKRDWEKARWRLRPTSDGDLVFATSTGRSIDVNNLLKRVLYPAEMAAAIMVDCRPKYDLHSLRHYFASMCINRKSAGGLELPAKEVSARMGHSDVAFTLNRYGHLFPKPDESDDMATIERQLFAVA
jgi:integrase